MRRIVAARALEGCLDSIGVWRYELSDGVDEPLMLVLAEDGRLQYFPHFPRPYFRIDRPGRWVIQGIVGDTELQVTFTSQDGSGDDEELRCRIER